MTPNELLTLEMVFTEPLRKAEQNIAADTLYEVHNFSRAEARISIGIANFFARLTCSGNVTIIMWNINIPENTKEIAHELAFEEEKEIDVEKLRMAMRFYADMINRLALFIISITIVITFFCTFVQLWIKYSS